MKIDYFTELSGNSPILKYLQNIDPAHTVIITNDIDSLEVNSLGDLLKSHDVGKVRNIWELRSHCPSKIIYRTLFGTIKNICHILNIHNKKTQKLKKHEIDLALKRFKQIKKS